MLRFAAIQNIKNKEQHFWSGDLLQIVQGLGTDTTEILTTVCFQILMIHLINKHNYEQGS